MTSTGYGLSLGQRIWDLETTASFTGGGTGVYFFFSRKVLSSSRRGDPAADVVSSLRDTLAVLTLYR